MNDTAERITGWVLAIAYTVACGVIIIGPSDVHTYLCSGSEQCGRDWISATGGWSAVVAAVITVRVILAQIHATNENHRDAIEIQLDNKYRLATKVLRSSRAALARISVLTAEKMSSPLQLDLMVRRLEHLLKDIEHPAFADFDRTVASRAMPFVDAQENIRKALGEISSGQPLDQVVASIELGCAYAKISADGYISSANRFLRRWNFAFNRKG